MSYQDKNVPQLKRKIGKICGFDWDIWNDNNRNFNRGELIAILENLESEANGLMKDLAGADING